MNNYLEISLIRAVNNMIKISHFHVIRNIKRDIY